ncbi:MAG: dockerin type I repeat-containing protein [Ruminococcus sp.]
MLILDGKIDVNDVTLLQRYIAGESVLTDDAVKAADFNKDRIIDVIDTYNNSDIYRSRSKLNY